jgi:hypothetical protein
VNFGLHNLKDRIDTPRRREWATPLWQNFMSIGILGLLIGPGWVAWQIADAQAPVGSTWAMIAWVLGGLALVVVLGIFGAGAIHRGRLVLDRDDRSLSFYRMIFWPRPAWRLLLADIAALEVRTITAPAVGPDDNPWTYRIAVAELRDGRLASITFDSAESIVVAIRRAADPWRVDPS